MSERDESEEDLPALESCPIESWEPPEGTRVHELDVAGETLLVISYPIARSCPLAETSLSSGEMDVARLAVEGLANAEIAARRGTSVRTVANQMASILRKLDVASRRELAAWYYREH